MENIETLLAAVAQTTGFGDEEPVASTPSELELEKPGSPDLARDDEISGEAPPVAGVVADLTVAVPVPGRVNDGGKKRRRGRPPKGHLPVKPPPAKRVKVEEEEEDVCFICFDGGSLVLCDRKGCPKAYHPACIKRDEAFFRSKAKWNCGWHICSVCRKSSHYFCYTCTYSLCKGCTRNSDYLCVRGNKGFCSTCMKTIMLIENKDQATDESIKVDFDDKLSWEYLFKMYWVLLKESLSLTLSELTQAKRPWKGEGAVARKPRLSNVLPSAVGEVSMPYISRGHLELNKPDAECKFVHNDGLMTPLSSKGSHVEELNSNSRDHGPSCSKETVKPNTDKVTNETSIDKATAKPAIRESVHVSCIRKDLNDPSIVKDTTKTCIHKNASTIESDKQLVNSTDKLATSVADGNIPTPINSRKRKTRKKSEDRVAQLDLNEYAAIDVHNINLIYLRRNLVERLIENRENFNDKVTGSIVRIKISANDQKPEVHRLVQVIGTCQVTEPYKIGSSTADVMLEVLNLDRKEVVSIVAISNEEFTEVTRNI